MKIIDFSRKGNVVRFYFGEDDNNEYYGDDWDDAPYEHNAGQVYDEFVTGGIDLAFPYNSLVLEPCEGTSNSVYCKNDMKARLVPCIIIVPEEIVDKGLGDEFMNTDFTYWLGADGVTRIYFGDDSSVLMACKRVKDLSPRAVQLSIFAQRMQHNN